MLSDRFILGTVQFGLNYGINNSLGKPSKQTVFEILDKAREESITELDSADAYGSAQELIGEYIRSKNREFQVNTKFSSKGQNIAAELRNTLRQLNLKNVNVYFFHRFEDFISHPELMGQLLELKESGLINKTGISIYTNAEFLQAIKASNLDVIQLPLNLLDNYSKRGDLVCMAKDHGKLLQVRSVFLQGLFFKEPAAWPHGLAPLFKYVSRLKEIALDNDLAMYDLALSYVLSKKEVDRVIIGVDSVEQLVNNLRVQKITLDDALTSEIDSINVEEESLLYPYNWK
ncbi:MAG TPA: aldo/keto reductase [Chitinophagaceae bacterium]|jgi:aryl-alcohol dehydrogenase-like predicted oxidoreductase|nr:aldo/keto reductase [Chitinophagaceae bacterium]